MSTDATIHLYLTLIRETQIRQEALFSGLMRQQEAILAALEALKPAADLKVSGGNSVGSLLMKWPLLLKPAASSAGQWAGGVLAMAWVLKGGDLVTALEALSKFFSQ